MSPPPPFVEVGRVSDREIYLLDPHSGLLLLLQEVEDFDPDAPPGEQPRVWRHYHVDRRDLVTAFPALDQLGQVLERIAEARAKAQTGPPPQSPPRKKAPARRR